MERRGFFGSLLGLAGVAAVNDPMVHQDLRIVTLDGEVRRFTVRFPQSRIGDYTAALNAVRDHGVLEIESKDAAPTPDAVGIEAIGLV